MSGATPGHGHGWGPPTTAEPAPGWAPPTTAEPSYPPGSYAAPGHPQQAYAPGAYVPPQPPPGGGGGGYPPGPYLPPGAYPPPAKPPRRRNGPLVALVVVIALLLCSGTATAGVLLFNAASNKAKEVVEPLRTFPTVLPTYGGATGAPVTVVYEVTGDGPVDLTYTGAEGTSVREEGVELPWRTEFTRTGTMMLSLMAIRPDPSGEPGELSCRTTVDGDEVAQRSAEGSFLLVSCMKFQY